MLKATIYVLFGLLGLVFGGEFIVDGASGIARTFGIQEQVIGLLIVGPGTSVPELITSIAAVRRKDVEMVLGNVLGSNIFNVFFTPWATAVIKLIPLGRLMGAFLLAVYVGYIVNALVS